MAKAIDELLGWLRASLKKSGMNTAALGQRAKIPRARARKILAGQQEMTVSELLAISEALALSPADLMQNTAPPAPAPRPAISEDTLNRFDAFGNQPEQLFRAAFALGCDFLFTAKVSELANSGVPTGVLERYESGEMSIKLDATYHEYNEPVYSAEGIQLTLSFDSLYTCRFPWTSIGQVIFFPYVPEPVVEKPKPKRPVLRLV